MFYLPHVPFAEIHQYLVEIAVIAATGISVYEFLSFKLHKPKPRPRRTRGTRSTTANTMRHERRN